jgi:hypothetical protein
VSAADSPGRGAVATLDVPARTPAARWPFAVVAIALFALAYENGGYGVGARAVTSIVLWWIVFLAVALGLVPRARLSRAARITGSLLAAFTVWTALSALWAPSAEVAFAEFDRSALYLAIFLVTVGLGTRGNIRWWLDGLCVAIVAIAFVSLVSRFFPHLVKAHDIGAFLPNAATRLSFPMGYWNALAVFVALGVPMLFAQAMTQPTRLRRSAAVACIPPVVSVVVLASSRGGVLALLVGTVVFVAATDSRWRALAAAAVAALGSIAAVLILHANATLLNGPLGTGAAEHAGRVAAVLLLLVAVATGAALVVGERGWGNRPAPSRRVGRALVVVAALVCIAALVAAHPGRRFDEFRQIPNSAQTAPNFTTAHLTSGSGSGRWQFWTAAVRQWESAPFTGGGAGSYRFWWPAHASFTYTLQNAHSLYLEVLGELGVVGLLLLGGAFGVGLVAGVGSIRTAIGPQRRQLAAVVAVLVAFVVCAGVDWLWQVTAVGAVGVVALGLSSSSGPRVEPQSAPVRPGWSRLAVGAAALLAAWVAIFAAAVPWLTSSRIAASQAAARGGNLDKATADAQDARAVQPWAASPYVQLALLAEARRALPEAVRWIRKAESRDEKNWATWFVAARIEREAGNAAIAAADYRRARSLNIRSPLFGAGGTP